MSRSEAMDIFKMRNDKMKNTQSIQWKMNLSIWTLIVVALYSAKVKDNFEISNWVILGFSVIHFMYCLLTQITINSDKALMKRIVDELNKPNSEIVVDISLSEKIPAKSYLWIFLQTAVTVLLSFCF